MIGQPAQSISALARVPGSQPGPPSWSAGSEQRRGKSSSGLVLHYPGIGNQLPLKQCIRLGEVTDTSRAVADRGSRLDDRFEDGFTGLLTETLIGHVRRRYLQYLANSAVGFRVVGRRHWSRRPATRSLCRVRTPGTVQQDSSTSLRTLCVGTVPVSVTRPSGPTVAVMRWCPRRVLRASAAAIAASMSRASRAGSCPAAASHTRSWCAPVAITPSTTGAVSMSWLDRRRLGGAVPGGRQRAVAAVGGLLGGRCRDVRGR